MILPDGSTLQRWVNPGQSKSSPVYTVVMPVFNKERIIRDVIECLINASTLQFSLILIDDASTDKTAAILLNLAQEFADKRVSACNLVDLTIISNHHPLFETVCDNIGFNLAKTDYIIEIQSDIYILDHGYDWKLIKVLRLANISTVSGRLGGSFSDLISKDQIIRSPNIMMHKLIWARINRRGLFGGSLYSKSQFRLKQDGFYKCETNVRGPWALKKKLLDKIGYLNESEYFLGNDDHEFNYRARVKNSLSAAYIPIRMKVKGIDGSTRQPRTGLNAILYEKLQNEKKGSPEFKNFLANYLPFEMTSFNHFRPISFLNSNKVVTFKSSKALIKFAIKTLLGRLYLSDIINMYCLTSNVLNPEYPGKGQSSSSYEEYFIKFHKQSYSQLGQDIAAYAVSGSKQGGFFVEFGACDGRILSNTYMLEKAFNWNGIVAEPLTNFHQDLKTNRSCFVDHSCVAESTGKNIKLIEHSDPLFTTTVAADSKSNTMGGSSLITISLNDLLKKYNAPCLIDYLSLDTEGTEFEILRGFDFDAYDVRFISVEHNYSPKRRLIKSLLVSKGYYQILSQYSQWDDWYASEKAIFLHG